MYAGYWKMSLEVLPRWIRVWLSLSLCVCERERERERCVFPSPHPYSVSLYTSSPWSSPEVHACSVTKTITDHEARRSVPASPVTGVSGMSNPRKDFDVKQILRIRWRWFGHPTSPPSPGNQPSGDLFSSSGGSSRGTGGSSSGGDQPSLGGCGNSNAAAGASSSNGNSSSNINNNRKFGDLGPNSGHSAAVVSASVCPRSMSQQECRSSPPAPWVFPAHSRSSECLEPLLQQQQQKQQQQSTRIKDAPAPGDEENNNNVESDSSSCRYGKHHWCGSSRAQQALVLSWYHFTTDASPAVFY